MSAVVVHGIGALCTCDPMLGEGPGVVRDAALVARDGVIVYAGPEAGLDRSDVPRGALEVHARGAAVVPGFVDAHTHIVWLGDRGDEYAQRASGATYEDIAAAGGGIRATEDMRRLLLAGADKCSINSAAVARPELVAEAARKFGSQCVVVAVDAKRVGAGWEVFTHGGRRGAGLDAIEWCRRVAGLGAGEILLTSMDRDGTQAGYDLELTRQISDGVTVPVIASGGAGRLDDFTAVLDQGHASAVLAASLFHFGTFTIPQVKDHLAARGVPVRR